MSVEDKMLPKEYGSGSTCHRRFREWNNLDVFKKTCATLLKIYDRKIGLTGHGRIPRHYSLFITIGPGQESKDSWKFFASSS